MHAKDSKISSWLNVLPLSRHGFDLSAQEFRDALAIRYKKLIWACLLPVMDVVQTSVYGMLSHVERGSCDMSQ